jgi:hypothetical protein
MYTFRRLMFALVAIAALVAATPAFAQNGIGTLPPVTFSTPAPAPKMQENEQGLGIFLQGGFVKGNTYSSTCPISCPEKLSPTGFIVGVGFGGNKSGAFGIGADINYEYKTTDNVALIGTTFPVGTLKTQVINIPVYGRVNFMGHATKSAPTLYILFGGYVDILMKGEIDDVDIKDDFNGFDVGPMGGIGFEVARVGIEGRGMWALKTMQKDGSSFNGMTETKVFTFVVLFKVRLN